MYLCGGIVWTCLRQTIVARARNQRQHEAKISECTAAPSNGMKFQFAHFMIARGEYGYRSRAIYITRSGISP